MKKSRSAYFRDVRSRLIRARLATIRRKEQFVFA